MELKDFFNKYNGRKIDFDGYFGFQCVDLYRQYLKELGLPQTPPVPKGAADLWTTTPFEKIVNTPLAIPKPGDIIVWSKSLNGYGHVGVCVSANLWSFISFEQNFPTGTGCHFQKHNYKHVIGWLRPKLPSVLPKVPLRIVVIVPEE